MLQYYLSIKVVFFFKHTTVNIIYVCFKSQLDRAKVHYFLPLVFFFRNDIPMPLKQQTHTHPPLLVNGYRVTIALTPFCASYLLVVFDSLFFVLQSLKFHHLALSAKKNTAESAIFK